MPKFMLCLTYLWLAGALAAAAETPAPTPADPRLALVQAALAWGDRDFWHVDHWEAKHEETRWAHVSTLMIWESWQAVLTRSDERLGRIASHFAWLRQTHWDPQKRIFVPDYAFMVNASVGFSLGATLELVGDRLPAETRAAMLDSLAGICAFLPTYTTALRNDDLDTRANNQEAHAASALTFAARELNDAGARAAALRKVRSILHRAQDCFWMEGGVDSGYQSVGEGPLGEVIDRLWDEFSRAEKRQFSDLAFRPIVTRGFGVENSRSPSWIKPDTQSMSAGYLARVPNPFIAAECLDRFAEYARKGLPSPWWLFDPTAVAWANAMLGGYEKFTTYLRLPAEISWGGLASQMMEYNEFQLRRTGDERAHLTSDTGLVAVFGNPSRVSPVQAKEKYGLETQPLAKDPGGLRYLGRTGHLYLWADARESYPRLEVPGTYRDPQLVWRDLRPGFAASQYLLHQVLPGRGAQKPILVEQNFIALGDVLLAAFRTSAPNGLAGVSYALAAPVERFTMQEFPAPFSGLRLEQKALVLPKGGTASPTPTRALAGLGWNCGPAQLDEEKLTPYLRKLDNQETGLSLRKISVPFTEGDFALLCFLPEGDAEQLAALQSSLRVESRPEGRLVEFSLRDREYAVFFAAATDSVEFQLTGGQRIRLERPEAGFGQCLIREAGQLRGYTVQSAGLTLDGRPEFSAPRPALVSRWKLQQQVFLELAGEKIRLLGELPPEMTSLITGDQITPADQELTNERLFGPAAAGN